MTTPVPRVGGRVLLVDTADRVMLIHERLEDGSTHWLTPGGGVEHGEDTRVAAVREALEETGLQLDLPAGTALVHETRRLWSWGGVTYDQVDHFYLARVPSGTTVAPKALTSVEEQTLLGFDWWTVAQLRDTTQVLLPTDLADVLDRVLTDDRARG